MPKAYGVDFRKKILEAYLNKENTIADLAKRFKISESTVKRIANRYRATGEVTLYLHRVGRHELIDEAGKKIIEEIITQQQDITLREIQTEYSKRCNGIKPVLGVFHRVLKKMQCKHKKKSVYAKQQEEDVIKKEKNF